MTPPDAQGTRPAAARADLMLRRRRARRAARRRIAAHVTAPVSAEQQSHDPIAHPRLSLDRRILLVAAAVLGALAVHGAAVGAAWLITWLEPDPPEDQPQPIAITVRERPPEPPPPPPEEAPAAAPEVEVEQPRIEPPAPPPEPPPRARAEPPPRAETPPPEPARKPPPRITGMSFESTTTGGDGPSFGTGNTRMGETEERARDPKTIPPGPPGPAATPATEPAPANRTASRIPSKGVAFVMPKRTRPSQPAYPELLKNQGIEADVTVMVSLDASGKVTEVKIIKPAPHAEFNEAARAAALAEEFQPATRDGAPIPYTLSFTYRFRLGER